MSSVCLTFFITLPFFPCCGTGRNDADYLNQLVQWLFFRERVSDQNNREAVDLANRLPALFSILDAVLHGEVQRI